MEGWLVYKTLWAAETVPAGCISSEYSVNGAGVAADSQSVSIHLPARTFLYVPMRTSAAALSLFIVSVVYYTGAVLLPAEIGRASGRERV